MKLLDHAKPLAVLAAVLALGAVLAGLFTPASTLTWLSLALALFAYFFVPGYALLLFLELDDIERVIFAFPTGAVIVPVALYFLNLAHVPLTRTTIIAVIVIETGLALFLWSRRKTTTSSAQ